MAKSQLKEQLSQTHKIDVSGILDADTADMKIEVEGKDESISLFDLFSKFTGQDVSISITNKTELSPDDLIEAGTDEE